MKKTISPLQAWLTITSVACLLISNVVTAKQMQLPFGITMTCAVFCFPITYILSDVFSEVYGYKWSRVTCYMGFAMNILMVLIFELSIATKAPVYWNNQDAFKTVLGSAPRVLMSSLVAFVAGDFANDIVFKKMKDKQGEKLFGVRAIASSLCGELTDSLIFIPCAFLGQMPIKTLATMLFVQVGLKLLYELIILPITHIVVKKVKAYET